MMDQEIVLDACCIINIFAMNRADEFFSALSSHFFITRFVAEEEALRLRSPHGSSSKEETIQLENYAESGLLTILPDPTPEELSEFIRFSTALDDGEAWTCAAAVTRGYVVATDDRKAIRVLGEWAPEVSVVQTPELLYEWAQATEAPPAHLRATLAAIRDRARFIPRKGSPKAEWWRSCLGA
jgi:hypothetical protein